jgi:hypothetical protein
MLLPRYLPVLPALALLFACSGPRTDGKLPPGEGSASKGKAADLDADIKPQAIDPALPTASPAPLIQRAECLRGTCTLSRWVPDEMQQSLAERGEVVLWEEYIDDKARVVFPADKEVELAGVVLEGSVGFLPREE